MIKNAFRVAVHNPSSLVFIAVVVSSFMMAYLRSKPPLISSELFGLAVLGVTYTIIGTLLFWAVIALGSVKYKIVYLSAQIILSMIILHLSHGSAWLIALPIVSHSVVLFSPRDAVLPCLLILAGMSWISSQTITGWMSFIQWMVIYSSLILFTAIFTNLAMREARMRENVERLAAQLEQANRELQAYAQKAEEMSATKERNRLAREIHDGLGHYLTAINMQSQVAAALAERDPVRAKEAIGKIQEMAISALADVRRSVASLRNDGITGKHLSDAFAPLLAESRQAGLATELTIHGEPHPLSPAMELALYRAVQEGLTNIQKHARASRVAIRLEYRPHEVFLQVQDNGRGADIHMETLQQVRDSYGLFGLRERVQLLGGEMRIETGPGAGFRFEIVLPENKEVEK